MPEPELGEYFLGFQDVIRSEAMAKECVMKTLLISPPYPLFGGETKFASPPLGLAYIAAVLEEAGQEVDVLDCVVADYDNE